MTSEDPHQQAADDCPPSSTDPTCDPKLIDDVACQAKGVAAQATYNETYKDALAQAKTDYDATRKDYRVKRHDEFSKVQDMRQQICHLLERIRCQIEKRRVWQCIDDAFGEVEKELVCCEPGTGCCAVACEFRTNDAGKLKRRKLVKRIASYQRSVDEAKACFDLLVKEPAALVARVAEAKDLLAKINAQLNTDTTPTDPTAPPVPAIDLKRVYAEALVANRKIELIWGGFDETRDFVDCLCRALTCWMRGCAAVSILTGAEAVAECQEEAKTAHCESVRTNTVDEILALYDRLCATEKRCEETRTKTPHDCDEPNQHPTPDPPDGELPGHPPKRHHDCCGHEHHSPSRPPCGCGEAHTSDGDDDPVPG